MSTELSLFELAAEIVRVHEDSTPGSVTVVPIVVDNLASARPVIEALCRVLEGRLFDASPITAEVGELDQAVPRGAETRAPAVEAALQTPRGRRVVVEEPQGSLIDVRLENPPVGPEVNAGDRTIMAIARAALHAELDRHEFAVVIYDAAIDLPFRRAAWDLFTKHFSGAASPQLRTLVVVSESAIDIDLHCQTELGFKYAIEDGELLTRQGRDHLISNARLVRERQREGPIVFFLGAGFAASSRLPLGNSMRDSAIRRILDIDTWESPSSEDLADRFYDWLAGKPGWLTESERQSKSDFTRRLTLERVVQAEHRHFGNLPTLAEFRVHHDRVLDAPGPAVRHLSSILEKSGGRIVLVEVNFDLLLERHATVEIHPFSNATEYEGAADFIGRFLTGVESAVPLLKLHGSIDDPESCVVSQEQTEQGVDEGKLQALRALLGTEEAPRLWVNVGASMRDQDLLPVFGGPDFARRLDEWWVNPYLTPSIAEYAERRRPIWGARRDRPRIEDRLITETADQFFEALDDLWDR